MDLSLFEVFFKSSLVVQITLVVLIIMSVFSWTVVIFKWFELRSYKRSNDKFETMFWNTENLSGLYQGISPNSNGSAGCFMAGFKSYLELNDAGVGKDVIVEVLDREMYNYMDSEVNTLDKYNSNLATVASIAPYIGLFGTVLGVFNAMSSLGETGVNTLSSVAPGIGEALIATAIGLFVAIPALYFHNKFTTQINGISSKLENFINSFVLLVQKQN